MGSVQMWCTSFCVWAVVPVMSVKQPIIFPCVYVSTCSVIGPLTLLNIYKILSIAAFYAPVTVLISGITFTFFAIFYIVMFPCVLIISILFTLYSALYFVI